MRRALSCTLLALTLTPGIALAGPRSPTRKDEKVPQCKGSPKLVGDCFAVHGLMVYANGSHNVRIFPTGTNRRLGVENVPNSFTKEHSDGLFEMPAELRETSAPGVDISGDFEVCPLTKKTPDTMQFVCVESAKNLVVTDDNKTPTRTYKIHDAAIH